MIHHGTRPLILGGTEGLGLAIAKALVAQGCTNLVLAARDAAKGEAVAKELSARFIAVDLGDVASALACVDSAAAQMGGIDALCIAGASTDRGSILDTTLMVSTG